MVHEEYFNYMYHLVANGTNYYSLLRLLDSIDFVALIPMDENRIADGISFRYRFALETGNNPDIVSEELADKKCSILEMMVALAFRVEENITCDPDMGDRTSQWFWVMMSSLGLSNMDDYHFNYEKAIDIIKTFLNREYLPNGKGGLFYIENPREDLRNVEYWKQCMWKINEY